MPKKTEKIANVPTHIITGFLGAGKTSTILHLLQDKPTHERWAVLVNEFGEIGVDGSLLQGQDSNASGIFIREVPGGCMCCTAGIPMQLALNQLLQQARPQRLLIEPTGLGHPKEVLQTLSSKHYQGVLEIEKVVTLVDARKLSDSRYSEHETFKQQIEIADVVVGNKQDLYVADEKAVLKAYVKAQSTVDVQVLFTEQGALELSLLAGASAAVEKSPLLPHADLQAPTQGEGFESIGWHFSADKVFERTKLLQFFQGLRVERLKAVLMTEQGVFGYNLTRDAVNETKLAACAESRVEIIATKLDAAWEGQLLACVRK